MLLIHKPVDERTLETQVETYIAYDWISAKFWPNDLQIVRGIAFDINIPTMRIVFR